jgi:hypothetical protein
MSIVIYNQEDFNSIENKIEYDNIDLELKKKIKHLINNYSCFKKFKKFNNFYKKNRYHSREIVPKTEDKVILSYLNKITNTNYDSLSIKIKSNIRDNNYKMIIDKLLLISFKQSNYSKLYINLYKLIIIDEIKCQYLNEKIEEILVNKNGDLNLLLDKISSDTYDEFCDNNKEKKSLKGKIKIIINLIKSDIIPIGKEFLIKNLIKYKNFENELYLELLQIINNISGLDKVVIKDLQNYLDNNNFKGKMMIKFKIQDIIQNQIIKEF